MVGIYSITNKVNGKRYIGQSVNILQRWRNHRGSVNNPDTYDYPLYRAIRKYGLENFEFEVLEECLIEELNDRETYYIDRYDTFHSRQGYNQTIGGSNSTFQKLDLDRVEEITSLLKDTKIEGKEIAERYGVTGNVISGINTGKYHKRDIEYPIRTTTNTCIDCGDPIGSQATRCVECYRISQRVSERPAADQLLEEVALIGFAAVGRKYGVSDNSIRKWMAAYNLPTKTNEVKKLYGNYKPKPTSMSKIIHQNYTLSNGKITKTFKNTEEACQWFKEQGLTTAKPSSIRGSINRVVSGSRQSYLGFKLK